MKLTSQEVEHIAKLARLSLNKDEKEKFTEQLSSILDYVKQLQEVDTNGVTPTAQVTGLENVMSQDAISEVDDKTKKAILDNAPEVEDNLIKAKSVFE